MIALIFLLIAPLVVSAERKIPALDPSCWLPEPCEDVGGHIEKDEACGGEGSEWGRCYPGAKPIALGIKIEGVGEVKDIAEYIALIYKYTVGVGAILATAMIVWGGIVYLTAGGVPERITRAKEYISNALIGLVLLYTSYLLLQTLNPDLVKLRMPRVYMIRPIYAGSLYCNELEPVKGKSLEFAFAADSPDQTPKSLAEIKNYPLKLEQTKCGRIYYEKLRGEQTCVGTDCKNWKTKIGPEEKVCDGEVKCVCDFSQEQKKYYCASGGITIDVTYERTGDPPKIVSIVLMAKCDQRTGYRINVKKSLDTEGKQFFIVQKSVDEIKQEADNRCGKDKFYGFFFFVTINDNNGVDDNYLIGKDGTRPIEVGGNTDPMARMMLDHVPQEKTISMSDVLAGLNPFRMTLKRTNFPTR